MIRFIDEAFISVQAGSGGPGAIRFRREKYVAKGGPDGGDGGKGGDIIFVTDPNLSTLYDFQYKRLFQAENGESGQGQLKSGSRGQDLVIRVPVGTIVRNAKTQELLADFSKPDIQKVMFEGGRGGKGNHFFKSSTYQTPMRAQPGEKGEVGELKLELKLLADVGLLGLPNAGKSTLLSRISNSKPKIANYPFTTLTPNLGVVKIGDILPFTVADIPGLIEGAHQGVGLGIQFLKHIERTKLLLHLIDVMDEDPMQSYETIETELKHYNPKLLKHPRWIVLTKADVFSDDKDMSPLQEKLKCKGLPIFCISSVQGKGLKELIFKISTHLHP